MLKQEDIDYINRAKEKCMKMYSQGFMTMEGLYHSYSKRIFEQVRVMENTQSQYGEKASLKEYIWEFFQEAHIPLFPGVPEGIDCAFYPDWPNELPPYCAMLYLEEPVDFEKGKKYTVRVYEGNSKNHQEHECTLYVYNKIDKDIDQIVGKEFIFPEFPEDSPFKDVVKRDKNLLSIYYHVSGKSLEYLEDKPMGVVYEGVACIEGYKPFEFVYAVERFFLSRYAIFGKLDIEENHPRWVEYYKFCEDAGKEYDRQKQALIEWLKS